MKVDLKFDYNDALKRFSLTQFQVDELRKSSKNNPLIPNSLTDKQLCLFVNACDGDVIRATQRIVKHYEIRKKAPQLFTKRDGKLPEIEQCFDNQFYVNLEPTPGNHLVCLFGLANSTAKNYFYDSSTKCFLMMIEAALYKYGTSNGLVLCFDLNNFVAGHMLRNNLRSLKKFLAYVQDGMPIKIHAIHIFNTMSIFNLIMAVIKPFIKPELVEKMHFHSSTFDVEEFTAEHIPSSHLPTDYGGVGKCVELAHARLCKEFLEMREWFEAEERQSALEFD